MTKKKQLLTVFNVGQGDAFLLHPTTGCAFSKVPLLIDTGHANAKLASKIELDRLNILITHSHNDHIGGLPGMMKGTGINRIQNLFIPYYLPEVIKISDFLNKYLKKETKKLNWNRLNKVDIKMVSHGDKLCSKHALVLNPPRRPESLFSNDQLENTTIGAIGEALNQLNELGIDLPQAEIINYTPPLTPINQDGGEYAELARKFVHLFFITLVENARRLPLTNLGYLISRHFELTSNQASIVFKYTHSDGDWLFTGDADEVVFDRLIHQKDDIGVRYLKIPHHGSRENISSRSLKAINPSHAIISHDNRKFGRSKDSHPHHDVIDLLDRLKIETYYTNPVIKDKIRIKEKTLGKVLGGLVIFK